MNKRSVSKQACSNDVTTTQLAVEAIDLSKAVFVHAYLKTASLVGWQALECHGDNVGARRFVDSASIVPSLVLLRLCGKFRTLSFAGLKLVFKPVFFVPWSGGMRELLSDFSGRLG